MGISAALGSSALLPAGLGFRNKIINGDFRINQRAFTSNTTSQTFGFDRWYHEFSGGTCTYTPQSFTVGAPVLPGYDASQFARLVNSSQTATSHYYLLGQKIEDVRNGDGCTVTVSFYAKAGSGTPSVAVELEQNFGSGGSTRVLTYVGKTAITTSWVRYSFQVVLPSISGKTIGTSSFLLLNLWVSAGSDFGSRTGSIGLQNGTFDFWGVQVEQNFQPTPFEQRPVGVELALCQRYYQRLGNDTANSIYLSQYVPASATQFYTVFYKTPTRTGSPTVTKIGTWSAVNSAVGPTISAAGSSSVSVSVQNDASIGNTAQSGTRSTTSAYIEVSDEL